MRPTTHVVLRKYIPGRDATARGFEVRAAWYGNGKVGMWAEYTDKEGGTLTHFALDPQELRAFLRFIAKTKPGAFPRAQRTREGSK